MKKITFNLEYVEWKDHHANCSWLDIEEIDHKPSPCLSVGWNYKEDEEGITLVANLSMDSDIVGNSQYILKNCITKRTIIRKGQITKKPVEPKTKDDDWKKTRAQSS